MSTPLPETPLHTHLTYTVAVLRTFDSEFRSFARSGDDVDVENVFLDLSEQASKDLQIFDATASTSTSTDVLVSLASRLPNLIQATHLLEEQIVQRLIIGYSACAGMRALLKTVASSAELAGDLTLARNAEESERAYDLLAARVWGLLPTRSLIAYNLLTATEVDPSVETKTATL